MPVSLVQHRRGFELNASVDTIENAFAVAVALVARLLDRVEEPSSEECVPVFATGASASALLAAFVEDLLVVADKGLAVSRIERIRVEPGTVRAAVTGAIIAAGVADIRVDRADLQFRDGQWRLRLVLQGAAARQMPVALDFGF